ncbi:MAG: hypothetical protein Q9165_007785 [Trypethelium subeluteriae]
MILSLLRTAIVAAVLLDRALTASPTDEYRDSDLGQTSYYDNHNMDPAVVDSSEFGLLWKMPFNPQEQFYAKPLVYTPSAAGSNQIVFLASSQNWIRTLDAKTGALINRRQVQTPFLQSDIGCTDIPNTIGITGTPVIDPNTDIAYFYAKTYIPNFRTSGNTGTFNGVYYFYAVNVNTLQDVPGFPLLVDGSVADNDPRKYFVGGVILQRPSLLKVGNYVYAGFGGHCDLFNYTGTVLGVDVTQQKVVTNFATESGPNSRFTTDWDQNLGGGQAGIWMSGMGLASDGNRLFFVTGNGVGGENQGTPASGSSGCRTLGEAAINLGIDTSSGKLNLVDYFQPYDYVNMDGGDQDFGSGGIVLLDPNTFHGGSVNRLGITAGKNGKIYVLNADNLGGYKQGSGQTDGIVQTIVTDESIFGAVGSYPLEGGYIYATPIGYPTYVYKLSSDASGNPVFAGVGQTTEVSAGRVGAGVPTITTNKGQPGSAILWVTDPDAGLRAWYAVPQADGSMKRINLPQIGGINKFQRPAFGDTRLYTTDANGMIYFNFGNVALGSTSTVTVNCTALIDVTSINGVTVGDNSFQVSNASLPQGAVKKGTAFSFPVTWNLSATVVSDQQNASFGNTSPGIKTTPLTILTTNAVQGYTTSFPLSLTGNEVSQDAYLSITPNTVDFGGLVLNVSGENPQSVLPFTIANLGLDALTILGYAYTYDDVDDDDADFINSTESASNSTWDLGLGFTASLPPVGRVVQPGESISVQTTFKAVNGTGSYLSYFFVYSDGGSQFTILEGAASTAPKANFSISNGEGGWLPDSNLLMDFGTVSPGGNVTRQIRICNTGGSVLLISKSKPPLGDIRAVNYGIDLHETQAIQVGDCAYGDVIFNPGPEPPNVPDFAENNTWTLNVNDLSFGVHVVQMTGTVHDRIVGPEYANGSAQYLYLGCYADTLPTRLLPYEPYVDTTNNTNQECQSACLKAGYTFAGTEYNQECWCGHNAPPGSQFHPESDDRCTFSCPGDVSQACGGNGGYISIYYDSSVFTPTNQTYNQSSTQSSGSGGGPQIVQSTSNFNYIGCYSEGSNGRALSGKAPATPQAGGSVEYCASQCAGFEYFGVEYANECYCGNTLNAGSELVPGGDPTVTLCDMTCGGNSTEYCGGPNRLNMYQSNGTAPPASTTGNSAPTSTPGAPSNPQTVGQFTYLGCYNDSVGTRALTGPTTGGNTITIESCASACKSYTYFGTEYADECYCGNSLQAGSVLSAANGNIDCNMACAGNSSELCGGPNRLSIYGPNPNASASSSSSLSTTTSTTGSSSTSVSSSTSISGISSSTSSGSSTSSTTSVTPNGPSTVPSAAGFGSLGCYNDSVAARALGGNSYVDGKNMTVENCAIFCTGYTYFGVEYAAECYCANTIGAGSVVSIASNASTVRAPPLFLAQHSITQHREHDIFDRNLKSDNSKYKFDQYFVSNNVKRCKLYILYDIIYTELIQFFLNFHHRSTSLIFYNISNIFHVF